jgi:hypothetical protein
MPDLDREAAADAATMTGGPDAWDTTRTHIDRINGQGAPAWIPGQGVVHTRDTIGGAPKTQEGAVPANPQPTFAAGQTPPGHVPLFPAQEAIPMADTDPMRMQAFSAAVQAGGPGEEIVANAQLFLSFLRGENDVPVKVIQGPPGEWVQPSPRDHPGLMGETGPAGPAAAPIAPPGADPLGGA